MQITHNAARCRFEAETDAGLAQAQYTRAADTVTFTHTEVPDAAAGQGVGTALVEAALAWARAEGLSVVPLCAFFSAYMADHRATHDLVRGPDRRWLDPDYDEPAGGAGGAA